MATDRRRLRPLSGSERPRPKHHRHVGAADPGERIGVTVVVRQRPGSPPLADLEYWHRTPLQDRRVADFVDEIRNFNTHCRGRNHG